MAMLFLLMLALAGGFFLRSRGDGTPDAGEPTADAASATPAASAATAAAAVSNLAEPDTTGASIWAHLQAENYQEDWALWPGMGRLYTGQDPHGAQLTTYLNATAMTALNAGVDVLPPGSMVVKENYMDGMLMAVTTMYKSEGYNGEFNDWFFTKHLASGDLDVMPNGMAMEGRLPGCQGCHMSKSANDFIFTGDIGG